MPRIVIIGGGFSGAALAWHLAKRGVRPLIIERGETLGHGVAYGALDERLLLNVQAGRMTIDPDAPGSFAAWAGHDPLAFVPRRSFAAFVDHALAGVALDRIKGEAMTIDRSAVTLRDGRVITGDRFVLATGVAQAPSPWPANPCIVEGWNERAVRELEGEILIVGAGLTAIDALTLLHDRRPRVTVLSRHGLLPRPHLDPPRAAPPLDLAGAPSDVRGLTRWVRARLAEYTTWQQGVDALRPHMPSLWRGLSIADRRRFLRHVRVYWDAHRHRVPGPVHDWVEAWRADGSLTVIAGRVAHVTPGLDVTIHTRGGDERRQRFDAIVRCTGPTFTNDGLLHSAITSGLAQPDPAGLYLTAAPPLYTLGQLRRGVEWESIAVPEIAVQARDLAVQLS